MGSGGKNGNSASGAEQTALNNQSQLNNQILGQSNQLAATNSQFYQPLLQGLSSAYGNNTGAISGGLSSGLGTALNSGGNLSGQTGVNPNQGLQQLTQYASQPGSTNLQGVTPGLQQFYQNEQNQGLNPQYAQNAQNQLGQASQQGMQNILAHAAPGTNTNALMQNNQSQLLQNSTNLQGNLAGQSQNFSNQGAQGVAGTASSADSQKLGMLQAGNTAGQQGNTQSLQNLLATLTQGQNSLNNSNSFMQQGNTNQQAAMNAMAGIAQQNASQASQFGQQAQQQQQGKNGSIGGLLGTGIGLATGGASSLLGGGSGLVGAPGGGNYDSDTSYLLGG